ncbi:MAG: hypothetical protein HeimAB125_19460 [Candidatus Heimdallarchaeota archaeon AB_125]|nr:MAG: hypothetical protein HeimAB125_19460 [Candidatus Heimdallarchaeota archaeon AB_125]
MPRVAKETKDKYAILGMLSHHELSGYDLREKVMNTIGFFWPDLRYSRIYPTLKKLEAEYLVTSKKVSDPDDKRPDKRIYKITAGGRDALEEWVSEPLDVSTSINMFSIMQELLLKIYLGGLVEPENTSRNLEIFKEYQKTSKKILEGFVENLEPIIDQDIDHKYILQTVKMGVEVSKSTMKWANNAMKELEEK